MSLQLFEIRSKRLLLNFINCYFTDVNLLRLLHVQTNENNKAAIVIEEHKASSQSLSESISKIFRSPSKAVAMAESSYAMSKPNSSEKMISQIERMIGRTIDSN